jgi:hypothetical protein
MARVETVRPPVSGVEASTPRFWDAPLQEQLYTDSGFKAVFLPTKGGGGTTWQNKEIVVTLMVNYADGTQEEVEVIGGLVDKITTQRSSQTAVMKIKSHAKLLQADKAEKVRDGSRWYENERLSYVLSRLLEQVFRDNDGVLKLDKRPDSSKLRLNTIDGNIGYWSLGKPPGWNGETYTPSPQAYPVTALCTGPERDYIYVGLGGKTGTVDYPPELWEYHIDTNLWRKLAETVGTAGGGDDDVQYGQIRKLWYNTADELIYGLLWKDDDTDPFPPAIVFWEDPTDDSAGLDNTSNSEKIDEFWSGEYDFREMFMADSDLDVQVPYDGGAGGETFSDNQPMKSNFRAGVGEFASFKYVMLPTPDGEHQPLYLGEPIEQRRRVHRYWPQPSWNNWDDDPIMQEWVGNPEGSGQQKPPPYGELIWATENGVSSWTNALGSQAPDGFQFIDHVDSNAHLINCAVNAGGWLEVDWYNRFQYMNIVYKTNEPNMTVYRLRVEGLTYGKIALGGGLMYQQGSNILFTGGPGGTLLGGYISGDGDYYFTLLNSAAIPLQGQGLYTSQIGVSLFPAIPSQNTYVNNLSLTVARYWDRSHEEKYSAGENLPITGFSKIIAQTFVSPTSHRTNRGPGFDWYADNAVAGRNAVPVGDDDLNMEYVLEFNFVAQDRTLLDGGIADAAWNSLWGPSPAEQGIAPDNSTRFIIGMSNTVPGTGNVTENTVVAVAPFQAQENEPPVMTNQANADGDSSYYYASRLGHGYGSVQVHLIGEPALWATSDTDYEISGHVRYTNGQQGFMVFSQEADGGNGMIMLCRQNGPAGRDGWGPDKGQHFHPQYGFFRCSQKDATPMNWWTQGLSLALGVIPTKNANTNPPYHTTDQYDGIYPIAGCVDDAGNFYISAVESVTYKEKSSTGTHVGRSYIFGVPMGTGAYAVKTPVTPYSSLSDNSSYATDGKMNNAYDSATDKASCQNTSRKILWLHYSKAMSKIMGWSIRRDSLLSDPSGYGVGSLCAPCHEVFYYGSKNILIIIDHDIADGVNNDAVGFIGFTETFGNFATTTAPCGEENATWYYRLKRVSPGGGTFDYIGSDLVLCCAYLDGSTVTAGEYWDNADTPDESDPIYPGESHLGNKMSVSALVDKGLTTEREAIFSSFDKSLSYFHIPDTDRDNMGDSIWTFFKLDDRDVDPLIQVADFTGLTVFDAIAQLSRASNFLFGFDINKFFMVDRDTTASTHTFDSALGQIKDITKEQSDNVKNVITIQPYTPQVQDLDWEITHVGDDTQLADESLFNGDLSITVKTHKELSMNMICTRKGRLIMNMDGDWEDPPSGFAPRDALDNPEDRYIPFFKWKTNAPTKNIVLMRELGADDTTVYVNTTFTGGLDPIQEGDAVIFTHPTSFVQFGRIVSAIDTVNSELSIEAGPGFTVEKGMPLPIVTTNVGNFKDISGNTKIHDYAQTWSDDGIALITAIGTTGAGEGPGAGFTKLTLNSIAPFRDFKFRAYNEEGYRYYPLIITTQNTNGFSNTTTSLPAGEVDAGRLEGSPTAWVWGVDKDTRTIYLPCVNAGFIVGDVINGHFAMPPATLIKQIDGTEEYEPPPYQSLTTDIPSGLAHFYWYCDELTDTFNFGDIINLHFKGVKLVKDAGSTFTGANMDSVARYGERPWNFPDNRFVHYDRARYWVAKRLNRDSYAKYKISATIGFEPSLSFIEPQIGALREVTIIDELMFPFLPDQKTSGTMISLNMNVANLTTTLEFISKEPY